MVECYGCGCEIPANEAYMILDYHLEREVDGVITVDQADALLMTCIECTPSRQAIAEALHDAGFPVPPKA